MQIRSSRCRRRTKRTHGVATECINTETKQHDTTHNLKKHLMLQNKLVHKTHAITRNQSIAYIAQCSAKPCDKAKPASLVQSTLNAKHTNRAQRCGHDDPHHEPFYQ